jgi:hypothetical protein
MKVKVNNREIETFSGALVGDALLKYSKEEYKFIRNGEKIVVDKHDNKRLLSGELSAGDALFIKNKC